MNPNCSPNPLRTLARSLDEDNVNGRFELYPLVCITLPNVVVLDTNPLPGDSIMRHLEAAIRTAYKSEDRVGPDSHTRLLKQILSLQHESTLEHFSLSFRVTCSRAVSHEIVRHRIGHSFTQESTRYVNYLKKRPLVIYPWHLQSRPRDEKAFWATSLSKALSDYSHALSLGWSPQDARGLLPHDLKTRTPPPLALPPPTPLPRPLRPRPSRRSPYPHPITV